MNSKYIKFSALIVFILLSLNAFSQNSDWTKADSWYPQNLSFAPKKVDVFYIASTNVLSAKDKDGNMQYRANLTAADRIILDKEFEYMKDSVFQSEFNYISPYYHQMTFEASGIKDEKNHEEMQKVIKEVCDAFDYYMEHMNNGRKFIIAGFSQGAILTLELLKHMTDAQYRKMIAAYSIGYRLSSADLQNPHIKAAKGAKERGVTISFNTVSDRRGMWDAVNKDAVTCINPVNWRTDSTPATFTYQGDTGTVHVDPKGDVLILDLENEKFDKYMSSSPVWSKISKYNRHKFDIVLYTPYLHKNAILRAYRKKIK